MEHYLQQMVDWKCNDELLEIPHVKIIAIANPTPNPNPAKRNSTMSIDTFFD